VSILPSGLVNPVFTARIDSQFSFLPQDSTIFGSGVPLLAMGARVVL
jgi:hypothetical protein